MCESDIEKKNQIHPPTPPLDEKIIKKRLDTKFEIN